MESLISLLENINILLNNQNNLQLFYNLLNLTKHEITEEYKLDLGSFIFNTIYQGIFKLNDIKIQGIFKKKTYIGFSPS